MKPLNQNNMEYTAVEWLEIKFKELKEQSDNMQKVCILNDELDELIEQAKKIEIEQMESV